MPRIPATNSAAAASVHLGFTEARGWPVDRYISWATGTLFALFLRER